MSTIDIQAAAMRWVDDHGVCLYRYGLVRVRSAEVAEECLELNWLDTPAEGMA